MKLIGYIKDLLALILGLYKRVGENRSKIKKINEQFETLAEVVKYQDDKIFNLEQELRFERLKLEHEQEIHELEMEKIKSDLKISLLEYANSQPTPVNQFRIIPNLNHKRIKPTEDSN